MSARFFQRSASAAVAACFSLGAALLGAFTTEAGAQPPAFPGAKGFGAVATGGRGGQVLFVTNLNADGPGSFQAALDTPGPRYILFNVSGVIEGIPHLTYDDVTIAGQTSPGGIYVRGFHTTEEPFCDQDQTCIQTARTAENWIMRFVHSRPGEVGGLDDGLRLLHTRRAIVDHLSIANATDEAIQISFSNDITVQYTLLAETLGGHAQYGGMLLNYSDPGNGWELSRITLHHNVWNRLMGRLPEISRESPDAGNTVMQIELANNLIWDPNFFTDVANESYPGGGGTSEPVYYQMNWIGNHYFVRPGHPYGAIYLRDPLPGGGPTKVYAKNNSMNLYPTYEDYQLNYCCNDFPPDPLPGVPSWAEDFRIAFPEMTYDPSATLRETLGPIVGVVPHDPMDDRLMRPVAAGTIEIEPRDTNPYDDALVMPWSPGPPPPPGLDSDGDGMPNGWEFTHGLDGNVQDHNGTQLSLPMTGYAGYTNLEVYLNELADTLITGPIRIFQDGFESGNTLGWSITTP